MNRRLQVLFAISLATLVSLLMTSVVLAHAFLVRSLPEQNAVLAQPPDEIHLWFSESVSTEFSTAELIGSNGQIVAGTQLIVAPAAPDQIVLKLPSLPEDVYTVRWQVLSDSDVHVAQGTVIFRVGAGSAILSPAPEPEVLPSPLEVLLRWLNFAVLAAIVGLVVIVYGVLNPNGTQADLDQLRTNAQIHLLHLGRWYVLAAILVGICLLGWQIHTLAGVLTAGANPLRISWQLLSTTSWGALWILRELVLLMMLTILGMILSRQATARGRWEFPVLAGLVACLMIAQSMSGHAAGAGTSTALDIANDSLHLLAAGSWVGGLLNLVIGVLPGMLRDKTLFAKLASSTIGPFSKFALLSVTVLGATGLYSIGQQVTSLDALITTRYGMALLAKVALVIVVGGFGLSNSGILHPRLGGRLRQFFLRPGIHLIHQLPRILRIEAATALAILLIAGFLTASYPARVGEYESNASTSPSTLSQLNGDMLIAFSASPNQPGPNVFQIRAVSTRRPAPAEIARVIVRFTYLGSESTPISVDAQEESPGSYRLSGDYFSLAGPYQVDVIVRRSGVGDVVTHFDWIVAPFAASRKVILSNKPLEPLLSKAASLGLLAIALTGIAVRYLAHPAKDSVNSTSDAAIHSATTIGNES